MKKKYLLLLLLYLINNNVNAQNKSDSCKVLYPYLQGIYTGECKKGLANGKGEATGIHRYIGEFKNGLPNGKGTYYFKSDQFHVGRFQDGLREGEGETHFIQQAGMPDSVVKGYWSANIYRGKNYVTYDFNAASNFDRWEITPSKQSGNTITIEISTTSGAPDGTTTTHDGPGYVLTLSNLISTNGSIDKIISQYVTTNKSYVTYSLKEFPTKLLGRLSNNTNFELDLYKAANWKMILYVNK